MIAEIIRTLKNDPGLRGPAGRTGPRGLVGPAVDVDVAAVVKKVLDSLPPVRMEIHDGDQIYHQSRPLGEPLQLRIQGLKRAP